MRASGAHSPMPTPHQADAGGGDGHRVGDRCRGSCRCRRRRSCAGQQSARPAARRATPAPRRRSAPMPNAVWSRPSTAGSLFEHLVDVERFEHDEEADAEPAPRVQDEDEPGHRQRPRVAEAGDEAGRLLRPSAGPTGASAPSLRPPGRSPTIPRRGGRDASAVLDGGRSRIRRADARRSPTTKVADVEQQRRPRSPDDDRDGAGQRADDEADLPASARGWRWPAAGDSSSTTRGVIEPMAGMKAPNPAPATMLANPSGERASGPPTATGCRSARGRWRR